MALFWPKLGFLQHSKLKLFFLHQTEISNCLIFILWHLSKKKKKKRFYIFFLDLWCPLYIAQIQQSICRWKLWQAKLLLQKSEPPPGADWSAWWASALWWQLHHLADRLRCWGCRDPQCWCTEHTGRTWSPPHYCAQQLLCQPLTPEQTLAGTFGPGSRAADTVYLKAKDRIRVEAPELTSTEEKWRVIALGHLPKVMTPCALTVVGREFVLNWDRGRDAGSSPWRSVNTQHDALTKISFFIEV